MAGPQAPPANQSPYVLTRNRFMMLVATLLFALAALAIAFGWDTPPWAFGFGAFGATTLAWAI